MDKQNKAYHIFFDKESNCVVMEWKGYSTTREFREGAEHMLDTLIRNNTTKVLGDLKDMTLISSQDQEWLNNNFLPRAINHGLKILALVQPESYFNKIAVETVSFKSDGNKLTIQFFKDLEVARSFINNNDED